VLLGPHSLRVQEGVFEVHGDSLRLVFIWVGDRMHRATDSQASS
jgi:hypothetical protein